MPSSTLSPKILKGGIVLLDSATSAVEKIIPMQYNPETITRALTPKRLATGEQSDALRLTGPPEETYSLDIELDATDFLEAKDDQAIADGLQSALSILETIIYPKSSQLISNNSLAASGTLEIIPIEGPLVLFIWSKNRVMPVQITTFSVTEEAFDVNLNPIIAKISLAMKVLTVDDLGFDHKGGSLYLAYHKQKEQLALKFKSSSLGALGVNDI